MTTFACRFRVAVLSVAIAVLAPVLAMAQDDSPRGPQNTSWLTNFQGGIGFVRMATVGEFSTFVPEAAPGVLLTR